MPTRRLAVLCALAALLGGCASQAPSATRSATPSLSTFVGGTAETPPGNDGSVSTALPTTERPTPAHPMPRPVDHCASNRAAKAVLVDISEQHMWMCRRGHTYRDTPITSGMLGQYTETPLGHYQIQDRVRDTTLTLNTGATYAVRYWIPFSAPLFGFHDSSWQQFPYGSARYKTDGSHGCVHMPLKAIAFLYRWAPVGTPVTIRP